jgi:PAS domain S-box-containing protein
MMGHAPEATSREPRLAMYLSLAILLPTLLIAFGLWLDGEYARMRDSGDLVDIINQRRARGLELVGNLRKAETGQRGYVITRNPVFMEQYEPSRRAVAHGLDVLAQEQVTGTSLARHAQVLRNLVAAKFQEMDDVAGLVRSGRQAGAIARVSNGQGQIMMDRIEAELRAIIAVDAARLAQSRAMFWERTLWSRQIVWLLVFTIGALLLVGTLLTWISRRQRWRVELGEAEASTRTRAILDSTSDAIVILNPSGTIENVNAAARSVLGYEPAELSRRDVSVLLDIAEGEGSFHERIGLLQQGQLRRTLFLDRFARTKDGRTIPVDVALGIMQVPDGLHIVASIRDISHRREIERIKDDFIATVSHELRTPLTSVVGSLGLLRGGAAGALSDGAAQLVEIAENNARRLIRLTNDILDMEKFGSGQMSLELAPTDLLGILRQSIDECAATAQAKAVEIQLDFAEATLPIMADRQRLLQVATNLLSNALRHTPRASTVTITAGVEQGKVIARVSDEGDGVPEEYRLSIFDRFVQAPVPGSSGGSGLGLAIAREIVERHGGRIWVEQTPQGGASFAISLDLCDEATADGSPQDFAPAPSLDSQPAARHALARPTILQVDDDEDLVRVVAAAFAGEARVIRANGITSARAIVELEPPDVVVLDIGLPDGSGLDLIPELVDREGIPLPTIIFTAQDCPMDLSGRVEAVLIKSRSSIPTLRETIRRIVAERARE